MTGLFLFLFFRTDSNCPHSTVALLKQWFWKCHVENNIHMFQVTAIPDSTSLLFLSSLHCHIPHCLVWGSHLSTYPSNSSIVCGLFRATVYGAAGWCIANSSVRNVSGVCIKVHFTDINKRLAYGLFFFFFFNGTTLASGHCPLTWLGATKHPALVLVLWHQTFKISLHIFFHLHLGFCFFPVQADVD